MSSASRWGIRPHQGRWLVGYVRGNEFIPLVDCLTLEDALLELQIAQEGLL